MSTRGKLSDWSADDLERAAKYMRELDKSANARTAFELAKREQDVEIAKAKAAEKEAEAMKAQAASQFERVRAEEARKNMEAKRENEKVCKLFAPIASSFISCLIKNHTPSCFTRARFG